MEVKRGMRVGLNRALRDYYFLGENAINLRADIEETAIIPEEISDANLRIINESIRVGHLVAGWAKEKEVEAPVDKKLDNEILNMGIKGVCPILEKISQTPGNGKDSPKARLENLMEEEKKGKNRKKILEKIDLLLGNIGGVSRVEETEKESVEIKIV